MVSKLYSLYIRGDTYAILNYFVMCGSKLYKGYNTGTFIERKHKKLNRFGVAELFDFPFHIYIFFHITNKRDKYICYLLPAN